MAYFPLLYLWRGEQQLLLWQSEGTESLSVNSEGYICSFPDLATLKTFADANGLQVEQEEPKLHDLDFIERWIGGKSYEVECAETLTAWNLFRDIANSVESPSKKSFVNLDSAMSEVYDKVFWGNNLPAVTPPGERFIPIWSDDELHALVALMSAGLSMFATSTQKASLNTMPSTDC